MNTDQKTSPLPPGARRPQGQEGLRALKTAFQLLRGQLIGFNERKQEFFCTVCKYRDPLLDGTKLHDDDCLLLAVHNELDALIAALPSQAPHEQETPAKDGPEIRRLRQRIAWLEGTAMPHARKQENANGFQKGWHAALSRAGEHAESIESLHQLVPEPSADVDDTLPWPLNMPVWKCKACGCLWRDNLDDTVSLVDAQQKSCAACEHSSTRQACEIHWLSMETAKPSPGVAALPSQVEGQPHDALGERSMLRSGDYHDIYPPDRVIRVFRNGSYIVDGPRGRRHYGFIEAEGQPLPPDAQEKR